MHELPIKAWESFYLIVGAAVLSLMFIGIHNAWDTVTYSTVQRTADAPTGPPAD